jgi:tetratricopeptide (TPR) repeat protein
VILMLRVFAAVLLVVPGLVAAQDRPPPRSDVEAISFLGDSLRRPTFAPAVEERMRAQLREAEAEWAANADDADAAIWVGRRLAYLGRYGDAIGVFSQGMARHPGDPRLYRHRGHRHITTRQLDRAIADLSHAAGLVRDRPDEVEPDGQPNARNIPTSTLQSNIWYHLALAHYLKGDFTAARDAWRQNLDVALNADMQVAVRHWLYMTLRRLGHEAEAAAVLNPVIRELDVIENGSYHRLLLFYKGELTEEDVMGGTGADGIQNATVAYGVGNWHLYNGRRDEALRIFRRILEGESWAAFGYIAAEAEVARAR